MHRETETAIVRAGFEIASIRRFRFAPDRFSTQADPKILGAARLSKVEPSAASDLHSNAG